MAKRIPVAKTRNAGTMTESAFWGFLRSRLRRQFRYWKPMMAAKQAARRPYNGPNKRQKFEFQCNHCKEWHADKNVQIDHINPTGSLLSWEDVTPFLQRLIPEDIKSFQVLCKPCHTKKTNDEREGRKSLPASLITPDNATPAKPVRKSRKK